MIDYRKRFERAWKDLGEAKRDCIDKKVAEMMYLASMIEGMTSSTDTFKSIHVPEMVKEILNSGAPNK